MGSDLFLYILCAIAVVNHLLSFAACGATAKSLLRTGENRHVFDRRPNYNVPPHSTAGRNFSPEDFKHLTKPNSHNDREHRRKPHGLQKTEGIGFSGRSAAHGTYGYGMTVTRPSQGSGASNTVEDAKVKKEVITGEGLYSPPCPTSAWERRKDCTGCPRDRTVMAARGNSFVILPEPCSTMRWMPMVGPHPGAMLSEGTHSLIGRLGTRGKICQYRYKVVVRRCKMFDVEGGHVNCTAGDAWGSACEVSCKKGREMEGGSHLHCSDDLTWSREPPKCTVTGCRWPKAQDNSKIWCHVPSDANKTERMLPPRTTCRYRAEGKHRRITCVAGYWVHGNGSNRFRRINRNIKDRRKEKHVG